ncbi:MAG: hypothetical protein ACLSHC_00110 [Bilophila wadsworthia]
MDFSPFSLLVVKVFSLITGGLGAEARAQIPKSLLEELVSIIAELKRGRSSPTWIAPPGSR